AEHIITTEAGGEDFISPGYSIQLDGLFHSIKDYIDGDSFHTRVGTPTSPPRPVAIGPGPPALLAFATNRTAPIHTGGGEIEFRAKPTRAVSGIVSYAPQQYNLNSQTDAQAAYVPKHKVTAIVTVNPIERLTLDFDVNTWSHFNTATPGLTQGLSIFAPGGVLFGKQVGE